MDEDRVKGAAKELGGKVKGAAGPGEGFQGTLADRIRALQARKAPPVQARRA